MFIKLCLVVVIGSVLGCDKQSSNVPEVYEQSSRNAVFTALHHQAEVDGAAYSVSGKFKTKIQFLNRSGEIRKVFWLDYEGNRRLFKELLPGQDHSLNTYLTHPWLITDKGDMALEIYFPDTKGRVIELR